MAVAWIFQGNPKTFDVDAYLRTRRRQWWWTVRQRHFADQFRFGDPVFIWRSDGFAPKTGGIVARGIIVGQPEERPDDVKELWTDSRSGEVALRVPLVITEVRLERDFVRRTWLENDPGFADLRILRMRNETNYRLTALQHMRLSELWVGAPILNYEIGDTCPIPGGRLALLRHLTIERDPVLVAKAITKHMGLNGELECFRCSLDLRHLYDPVDEKRVEMHDTHPVEMLLHEEPVADINLVPVCPNCHRLLHLRRLSDAQQP